MTKSYWVTASVSSASTCSGLTTIAGTSSGATPPRSIFDSRVPKPPMV